MSHAEACKKRQSDTGTWFLEGSEYNTWKAHPASLIWLHGIRECIICTEGQVLADGSSGSRQVDFMVSNTFPAVTV